MKIRKYSIVYYLEGEILDKVRALQHKITKITSSQKCINSWMPHLTIGSGIVVSEDQQEDVNNNFRKISESQNSFELKLSGFGGTTEWSGSRKGITTPYVLWINPIKNNKLQELFLTVKKEITDNYEVFYPRIIDYTPHITVAYGDLDKAGYEKGMEYLAELNFEESVNVNHIALVENFPNKDVEYKRFNFLGQ